MEGRLVRVTAFNQYSKYTKSLWVACAEEHFAVCKNAQEELHHERHAPGDVEYAKNYLVMDGYHGKTC